MQRLRPLRPLRPLLSLALLALATLPVHAKIVTIAFDDEQRFSHRFEVPPGQLAEACGRLPPQSTVQWQFSADGPLDFNIHHHEGKAVHYAVRHAASAGAQGTLRAEAAQPYCWMWRNKAGAPASLVLELRR